MPAPPLTQTQFVACFWRLASTGDPSALRVAKYVRPEAVTLPGLRSIYGTLLDRAAAGTLQDDAPLHWALAEACGEGGVELVASIYAEATESDGLRIEPYARELYRWWQADRVNAHLKGAAESVERLAAEDPREAVKHAEAAMYTGIIQLREHAPDAGPQSRAEYAAAERAKLTAKGIHGCAWPFPKMQRVLGHIRPGKVYGISALPGVGKSTLLANLFNGFVRRGVPMIVAPTEMRDEWLSRAYAAAAGVPQEIAENALWDADDDDIVQHLSEVWELGKGLQARQRVEGNLRIFRDDYVRVIDEFEGLPWEVIGGADLTIDEILVRLQILRRRFAGRFVIVAIDHMHNLSYPNGETDRHVGAATKRLREFCQDDRDGGMAVIALFQPRKPEKAGGDHARFKPLPAQEVRGQVAQVLDVHMSIYHQRVRLDPTGALTPWGTPRGLVDPETGYPIRAQAGDPPAEVKDDDERIYIKPDKRRRHGGSRSTASFILEINAETGEITERDRRRYLQAM